MKRLLCVLLCWANLSAYAQIPYEDTDPVTMAAAEGDVAALTQLLDKGASVDERNPHGWPPLVCALYTHKSEVVRLLLARHANPNILSAKGCSALDFAVMGDCDEDIVPLLDAGADIHGFRTLDSRGAYNSPLFLAFERHRLATIKILLSRGAHLEDKNNEGTTALMQASKRPYGDQVALLIDHGANVNAHDPNGHTALIYAAYNGNDEAVSLLLNKGADPQAVASDGPGEKTYGAWEVATEQGHPYVLEALDAAGVKPTHPKNPLNEDLNEAIGRDDYERTQAALAKGASPTEPDANDVRPITVAVLKGNVAIVQLLIKAGADVNVAPDGNVRSTPSANAQWQITHARSPQDKARFEQVAEILRKAGATR